LLPLANQAKHYYDVKSEAQNDHDMDWFSDRDYGLQLALAIGGHEAGALIALGCGNLLRECRIISNCSSLRKKIALIVGADLSPAMLAMAQSNMEQHGISGRLLLDDFRSYGFRSTLNAITSQQLIVSLLGGTLSNQNAFTTLGVLREVLQHGDLLWIDFPLRQAEPNASLLEYMARKAQDCAFAACLLEPLRYAGAEQGEIMVDAVDDDFGVTTFRYIYRFSESCTVRLAQETEEMPAGTEIEIFALRRASPHQLDSLVAAAGFQIVSRVAKNRQIQMFLQKL
jgi:hypothetical protein